MKRVLLLAIIITMSLGSLYFLTFKDPAVTGFAIYNPPSDNDCSNESIKSLWDSIFQESSSGAIVIANYSYNLTIIQNSILTNKCYSYAAYKIKNNEELFLLFGSFNSLFGNAEYIFAIRANVTSEYAQRIRSIKPSNLVIGDLRDDTGSLLESVYNPMVPLASTRQNNNQLARDNLTSVQSAFKLNLEDWEQESENSDLVWIWLSINNSESTKGGLVKTSLNYTQIELSYVELIEETAEGDCIPNWQAVQTPCQTNGNYTIWYNDTNTCNSAPPSSLSNHSYICTGNKVLGNISSSLNLSVEIDSESVLSYSRFNGINKVELFEQNRELVEFYYNFSADLNLSKIQIIRQSSNYSFGYLIINGITSSKTAWIDRINSSSNRVCVKSSHISSISEMSTKCNGTNEKIINCPGGNGSLTCSISSNRFEVEGILNSSIKELPALPGTLLINCTPYWNCTIWEECTNNVTERTCLDTNFCNTTFGKPAESQDCALSCEPLWNCTSWEPEECPKNKTQVRTCSDENQCGNTDNLPETARTCTPQSNHSNLLLIVFIIILILAVAGTIFAIMWLVKTSKQEKMNSEKNVFVTEKPMEE